MDSKHSKNDRLLWWQQGLSWISSIGILSSGVAIATPEPSTQAADLLPQTNSSGDVVVNGSANKNAGSQVTPSQNQSPAIDPLPQPEAPAASTPQPPTSPSTAKPLPQPQPEAPAASTPQPQTLPSTRQALPTSPQVEMSAQGDANTPLVVPNPKQQRNQQPSNYSKNQYIDSSSDFELGATPSQQSSPQNEVQVVMQERSTGCERVVNKGDRISGEFCPPPKPQPQPRAIAGQPHRNYNAQPATPRYRQPNSAIRRRQASSSRQASSNNRSVEKRTVVRHSYYGQQAWENIKNLKMPGNDNTSLLYPLSIPATITSVFGWRTHPIFGDERFHTGTDIGAPKGTPVVAALGGRVAQAGWIKGYGLTVIMEHLNSNNQPQERTLYAHLSRLWVEAGDWVEQGTAIAEVGSTGYSTGAHLHFEWQQATSEGWAIVDPGDQLEYGLANLVRYFEDQVAQNRSDEAEEATESETAG